MKHNKRQIELTQTTLPLSNVRKRIRKSIPSTSFVNKNKSTKKAFS